MKIFPGMLSCTRYFLGLLFLIVISILFLLKSGKTESFVLLNHYHSFSLNNFFIGYTFLGDGLFSLSLVVLFFLIKKRQFGMALLLSFLLSGLASQVMKNFFNAPRPKLAFEAGHYPYFIDGITLSNNASFPSGHTATAFAIATVLVLLIRNKKLQLPILIAATLVGYSRIYLGQHFLADVIAGAIIGMLSGIAALYLIKNFTITRSSSYDKKNAHPKLSLTLVSPEQ